MGEGSRFWAAVGNLLRVNAIILFAGAAYAAFILLQLVQRGAPVSGLLVFVAITLALFGFGWLYWIAKSALIAGSAIAQLIAAFLLVSWVISTAGVGLIVLIVVYVLTGTPQLYGDSRKRHAAPPQPKLPPEWRPTGEVGRSGATLYFDPSRSSIVALLESGMPVQALEGREGFEHVIAASGHAGWIDSRTYAERALPAYAPANSGLPQA